MTLDLSTIDNSYLLFIRSNENTQLTENFNTNMRVDLNAQIAKQNQNQDIHLQLSSCEIPNSFYNISTNLNNYRLFVNGASSLILESQHFDIYELIDAINNDVNFNFTATFNEQKNKITLTTTSGTQTINFSSDESEKLARVLGFNSTDKVVTSSITSDFCVNLNTIHSIFVHTNLSIGNVLSTTTKNYTNILQKIPVNTSYGDVINYNPYLSSQFSTVLNINEINSIELTLRDQNGILLDLNNVNYEISLLFEIHDKQANNQPIDTGGRRNDTLNFGQNIISNPPSINQITLPDTASNDNRFVSLINTNQTLPLNPEIPEQTPVLQKPNVEAQTEDKLLSDKQESEIQNKLIELSLLDDII